jgi:4-amino-4-deoxy-L-arabinose transferase-like glycosyltransferase
MPLMACQSPPGDNAGSFPGPSSRTGTGLRGLFADRHLAFGLAALLALHVVTWTLYGTLALGIGTLHDDMAEAWVWGQEWQLGYFKHPPLFGWVAGAWFHLFPRADWSFYLLASLNSAVGLAGAAALAHGYLHDARRLVPVIILLLTPLYGLLALKFNANAILVPVWPWTAYAFLRCLDTGSVRHGLAFGALAALAMLGKYYSALLLVSFLVIALLPAHRQRLFGSPAPYVAIAMGTLLIAPHLWWSITNGFPPVVYAASKFKYPLNQLLAWAGMTALAPLFFFGAVMLMLWLLVRRNIRTNGPIRFRLPQDSRTAALIILTALPFILTAAFGLMGHAKVSLSYTIPIFFGLPILLVAALGNVLDSRAIRSLTITAVILQLGVILTAPVVAYARVAMNTEGTRQPNKQLAVEMTRLWHHEVGTRLRVVAGTSGTAPAISFYSPDSPSLFINFRFDHAPWVTPKRIEEEGMLIVCAETDRGCLSTAKMYKDPISLEFRRTLHTDHFGQKGPDRSYILFLIPPVSGAND